MFKVYRVDHLTGKETRLKQTIGESRAAKIKSKLNTKLLKQSKAFSENEGSQEVISPFKMP